MKRSLILIYSLVCYVIFLGTFLYLIAFVENVPILADYGFAKTVDGPSAGTPVVIAILIDLALIALFGVQHSIMARQEFKAAWTRIVPWPAERATYVLIASLILMLLFWQWQPISAQIWSIENEIWRLIVIGLSLLGWGVVLLSTFLLGHFHLFGLAQSWANLRDQDLPKPQMSEPLFYKVVRHPLYFGFLLAFWAAPVMTVGHLVFAAGFTAYVLIAIRFEERDLIALFGERYIAYRQRVSMLIPLPPKG